MLNTLWACSEWEVDRRANWERLRRWVIPSLSRPLNVTFWILNLLSDRSLDLSACGDLDPSTCCFDDIGRNPYWSRVNIVVVKSNTSHSTPYLVKVIMTLATGDVGIVLNVEGSEDTTKALASRNLDGLIPSAVEIMSPYPRMCPFSLLSSLSRLNSESIE